MRLKKKPYKFLIKEEAKSFDRQATFRTKKGLIPDIRRLKKNTKKLEKLVINKNV